MVGDLGPRRPLGTPGDPPEELEEVAEEQEAWVHLLRLLPPVTPPRIRGEDGWMDG